LYSFAERGQVRQLFAALQHHLQGGYFTGNIQPVGPDLLRGQRQDRTAGFPL
jgi:hypothetical protein